VLIALALAVIVLIGSALVPTGWLSGSSPFSVRRINRHEQNADPLGTRLTHVYDSKIPAKVYGTEIGDLEDLGENTKGQMIDDIGAVPAAAFKRPVAAYKRYAAGWLRQVATATGTLTAALRSGSRRAAETAWMTTWSDYLHLGAVYGLFGQLNQQIDGMPGQLVGGTRSSQFTGLHRLEWGLWTGQRLMSLVRFARRLLVNVNQLQRALPRGAISPLDYATRSHEILEDAQRDLLSGVDVPWSGQGVLGTAAGVTATKEVVATLTPLLQGRDNTLVGVHNQLLILSGVLARIRREHHGTYPSLTQLSTGQRELLDGTLAGALTELQELPGTLETNGPEVIPSIRLHR
jgi:iron uptake system EfeUOB component EfeO/EfeM